MKQEDLTRLENRLLHSSYPDEDNYNNGERKTIGKKMKKAAAHPRRYIFYAVNVLCGAGIVILLILIVNMLNSPPQQESGADEALDGFDNLIAYEKDEAAPAASKEAESEDKQTATGYFVNPLLEGASAYESIFQLGEKAYKLPVAINQLEADGAVLITLGSQPPAEDVILNPQMRSGYLQFENYRFYVTVKNGYDCTYHDLTVVEIVAEESGCPFYTIGGLTIGSQEAAIPQTAERIEQDILQTNTYYYWGSIDNAIYNITGRRLIIGVSNETGQICKVSVFDDGSMGSEPQQTADVQ